MQQDRHQPAGECLRERVRFVVLFGMMGWGIPGALLYALGMHLLFQQRFLDEFAFGAFVFPLAGVLFGLWLRARSESRPGTAGTGYEAGGAPEGAGGR